MNEYKDIKEKIEELKKENKEAERQIRIQKININK